MDDPALGNHPRLRRRFQNLLAALPDDVSELEPIAAGSRAKRAMQVLAHCQNDFSGEFVGEMSASASSVFILVTHFEEWRRFELRVNAAGLENQSTFRVPILEIADQVKGLSTEIADKEVADCLAEFVDDGDALHVVPKGVSPEVDATLRAYVNYAAISTANHFAAVLIREIRKADAIRSSDQPTFKEVLNAGVKDGVKNASSLVTSGVILITVIGGLKILAAQNPAIMGWITPFIDRFESIFSKSGS